MHVITGLVQDGQEAVLQEQRQALQPATKQQAHAMTAAADFLLSITSSAAAVSFVSHIAHPGVRSAADETPAVQPHVAATASAFVAIRAAAAAAIHAVHPAAVTATAAAAAACCTAIAAAAAAAPCCCCCCCCCCHHLCEGVIRVAPQQCCCCCCCCWFIPARRSCCCCCVLPGVAPGEILWGQLGGLVAQTPASSTRKHPQITAAAAAVTHCCRGAAGTNQATRGHGELHSEVLQGDAPCGTTCGITLEEVKNVSHTHHVTATCQHCFVDFGQ